MRSLGVFLRTVNAQHFPFFRVSATPDIHSVFMKTFDLKNNIQTMAHSIEVIIVMVNGIRNNISDR